MPALFTNIIMLHHACSWWLQLVLVESRGYPIAVFRDHAEENQISKQAFQNKMAAAMNAEKVSQRFWKDVAKYHVTAHYVSNQ